MEGRKEKREEKKGSRPYSLYSLFFILFSFFFISCATSPKAEPVLADGAPDFSVLPAGANIYLWTDVERSRPLLDVLSFGGFKGSDASKILDRTETAIAASYPEGAPQRFFLAAWGEYPKFGAGASLGFSRDWKKIKSGTGSRYWYSKSTKLGVAMGSDLAIVSNGDPFVPSSGIDPVPDGFEDFRRACVLAGWLNNPDIPLNSFMESLGIPLQIPAEDFFFGITRVPADLSPAGLNSTDTAPWEFVFGIRVSSASQARSLVSLFSMARFFIQMGAGSEADFESDSSMSVMELVSLLFSNSPEQNEDFLTLRIGPLNENRIALLLSMFPVYSN